jgi:hypothetical protein
MRGAALARFPVVVSRKARKDHRPPSAYPPGWDVGIHLLRRRLGMRWNAALPAKSSFSAPTGCGVMAGSGRLASVIQCYGVLYSVWKGG